MLGMKRHQSESSLLLDNLTERVTGERLVFFVFGAVLGFFGFSNLV